MKSTFDLRRCGALLVALLCFAPLAHAQSGKWWTSDQYVRELTLTQDQSRRIEEVFQDALPTLRVQKKALDDAEQAFGVAMRKNNYSAVMEIVEQLESARAALNRSRTLMLVKMRQVLTKDQWIKLDALHQADEARKAAAARDSK